MGKQIICMQGEGATRQALSFTAIVHSSSVEELYSAQGRQHPTALVNTQAPDGCCLPYI